MGQEAQDTLVALAVFAAAFGFVVFELGQYLGVIGW